MPSTQRKRKAEPQPIENPKKTKIEAFEKPKDKVKLAPLGEREINRAPADCHSRKKDGKCRKDCVVCKDEKYEWEALNDPDHVFHSLHVCRAKGRDGSPTLDQAGYELDYDKVMNWFKPVSRQALKPTLPKMKRQEEHFAKQRSEEQQTLDAFFEEGAAPSADAHDFSFYTISAVQERVEKDIGVPWHKVDPDAVRKWEKRGFQKAKKGEYKHFSEEDRKRFMNLLTGASLRK